MQLLKVKNIEKTTNECSIITFSVPEILQEQYKFIQGQYLTLEREINEEPVRRSYSLCSSPMDNEWKIGVKEIEGGRFSTFANRVLKVGDEIKVGQPEGKFYIPVDKDAENNYVFFAAGSGITPIFSLIKTYLLQEPNSTVKLFYANRTVSSIILKEELEALKNMFMGRFEIFYFLTRQSRSIPLLDGRIDTNKIIELEKAGLLNVDDTNHFFSCGPEEMVFNVRDYLISKLVASSKIHFELFNTSGPTDAMKAKVKKGQEGKTSEILIIEGGKTLKFNLDRGSNNILDAALANNADLPYACKGGVCCTCKAKVKEGKVEMLLSYGLEQDEIDDGYVLTCQAFPMTDKVVVDFDS